MDTITHAVIGALAAQASTSSTTAQGLTSKERLGTGAVVAALPDLDYITVVIHPLLFIAQWHRSITHSLVMLPCWVFLLGWLLAWWLKKPAQRPRLMMICTLSLISHVLGDMITNWGTRVFAPLSDYAPAWGLTFVVDPYLSAMALATLVLSLCWQSRSTARWGVMLLCVYVAGQGVLKNHVRQLGQAYVDQQQWSQARSYIMPQPLSPFHWKLVVIHETHYHMAFVDLLPLEPTTAPDAMGKGLWGGLSAYRPVNRLIWQTYTTGLDTARVREAWNRPEFVHYRQFAVLPFVVGVSHTDSEYCTWFGDLRFVLPDMALPFRYGLCQEIATHRWLVYRLTSDDLSRRVNIPVYGINQADRP